MGFRIPNPVAIVGARGLVLAALLLAPLAARPQAPAPPAPRTYALVSAIGSTFMLVRQKKQVGTMLEPYQRFERPLPGAGLDAAVLRGLERIVREDDPAAELVYMKLNPAELDGAHRYERGAMALGKLAAALEKMPQRAKWHRILVVTPRYMNGGREGLGEKLHGIGVYVQPSEKLPSNNEDFTRRKDATRALDGTPGASDRYVAPYFYAQVSVIDPATLKVLETSERWDFEKLFDPKSTRADIEDDFPPEVLAARVERFVELATADALREAFGTVTVSEPRIVAPGR